MTKITAAIISFSKTKTAKQLARVARIALPGLVALAISHNGVAAASVGAVVEAAFRQVFPA